MPSDRNTLPLRLDRTAKTSLVEQIRQGIHAAIHGGVLLPGARLPSWQVLATQLGVARGTVRQAYERLIDAQLIVSLGSAGTHVTRKPLPRPKDPAHAIAGAVSPHGWRGVTGGPAVFQTGVPAPDAFATQTFSRLRAAAFRESTARSSLYSDPCGDLALRREIAAHVAISRGIECSVGEIFITSGFGSGLSLIMHVLQACGRTAWVEDPSFPKARQAMRIAGVTTVPVPVDDQGIDVDAGIRLAPQATLAMVTPAQQAPLGPPLSHERRLRLIAWASHAGAWIVENDQLGELQLSGRSAPALASLDRDGRVIHVGSFSRTISPSLRLGFVVVPPALAPGFVEAVHGLMPAPESAVQIATARFMGSGHYLRHLRRMKRVYATRRDTLIASLAARGLDGRPAGHSVLVDLPAHVDDTAIVRAAESAGIAPAPLSSWFASPEQARPGLLLGVAMASSDRVDEACDRLRQAVDSVAAGLSAGHPGRPGGPPMQDLTRRPSVG